MIKLTVVFRKFANVPKMGVYKIYSMSHSLPNPAFL